MKRSIEKIATSHLDVKYITFALYLTKSKANYTPWDPISRNARFEMKKMAFEEQKYFINLFYWKMFLIKRV